MNNFVISDGFDVISFLIYKIEEHKTMDIAQNHTSILGVGSIRGIGTQYAVELNLEELQYLMTLKSHWSPDLLNSIICALGHVVNNSSERLNGALYISRVNVNSFCPWPRASEITTMFYIMWSSLCQSCVLVKVVREGGENIEVVVRHVPGTEHIMKSLKSDMKKLLRDSQRHYLVNDNNMVCRSQTQMTCTFVYEDFHNEEDAADCDGDDLGVEAFLELYDKVVHRDRVQILQNWNDGEGTWPSRLRCLRMY